MPFLAFPQAGAGRTPDGAASAAGLSSAVVVSQQLLDEHGKRPGYRTSAEWLAVVARKQAAAITAQDIFRQQAISRLAAQHDESSTLRDTVAR